MCIYILSIYLFCFLVVFSYIKLLKYGIDHLALKIKALRRITYNTEYTEYSSGFLCRLTQVLQCYDILVNWVACIYKFLNINIFYIYYLIALSIVGIWMLALKYQF